MATRVIMPQLGESVVEGTVTKWLRQEGETINEFDALLEVNTDKVDTEIPSPASGTLLRLLVPEGTTVQAGTVLAWIGDPGETLPGITSPRKGEAGSTPAPRPEEAVTVRAPAAEAPKPEAAPAEIPVAPGAQAAQPARPDRPLGFISPVVARLAKEHNLDLSRVNGTGAGGRITKQDVLAYLEKQPSAPTAEEPAAWETPGEGDLFRPTELMFPAERTRSETEGVGEKAPAGAAEKAQPAPTASQQTTRPAQPEPSAASVVSLSPMRRLIAEHMVQSNLTAPHVTTVMEADMSAVSAHRQAHKAEFEASGTSLTYSAYFVAAAVAALKAFPIVNSSWGEDGIHLHRQVNIGMAASLGEEGLIVPVIKAADGLSLLGIARAVNDLAGRARSRRLQPDEVKGGTFTITNHGTGGSLFATPIINQPQCAILGVGLVQKRAVVINDAIAIRPMVYLSLSFDHRILDGASADAFLARVVGTLEKWV